MARRIRSGTFVGPGTKRNWRPGIGVLGARGKNRARTTGSRSRYSREATRRPRGRNHPIGWDPPPVGRGGATDRDPPPPPPRPPQRAGGEQNRPPTLSPAPPATLAAPAPPPVPPPQR